MQLHAGDICLCGVLRFGGFLAVRDVPRAGTPGRVCLPGLSGRPGTRKGHGRLSARGGTRWRLGASIPCRLTARTTTGGQHRSARRPPTDMASVPRPAARAFQRRPQAPPGGVQPHRFAGAAKRPCRRAAGNGLGVAAQQRRQGGGVQPPRLATTARSVVSTSEAGTDDAGNATSCKAAVPDCRDNGGTTGFDAR